MEQQDGRLIVTAGQWLRFTLAVALGLFLGLGTLVLTGLLAKTLTLVFLAISIAAAIAPLVTLFQRRLPRSAAIIVIYLILAVILVGIVAIIVPALASQMQELINRLPSLLERAEEWVANQDWINNDSIVDAIVSQLQGVGEGVVAFPLALASALLEIILVVMISLYLLLETHTIRRFSLSLFPQPRQKQVWDIGAEILGAVGGFIRGVVLNILIISVVTFIGFSLIGLEFPLVLAIIAGLFEVIPVLGPLIAAVPALIVALLISPTTALITLVFLLIIQQFEGNILTPNVMHKQAKVSPLLVLVAVFAGGTIGGVLGALVAIPLVATLRILMIRVVAPAIQAMSGAAASERTPPPQGDEKSD